MLCNCDFKMSNRRKAIITICVIYFCNYFVYSFHINFNYLHFVFFNIIFLLNELEMMCL